MRVAVQDYRTSRVRARSVLSGDPLLRLFYLEMLFALHETGGMLPADAEYLADEVQLPAEEVARCLAILVEMPKRGGRGGLVIVDGQVSNQRVTEDLAFEHEFRSQQAERGRSGGLATARRTLSPPAPAPSPAPTPSPEKGAAAPASAALLSFPTIGKGPSQWHLSEAVAAEWGALYPSLDILAECRGALAWVLADAARRKTAGGMPRFLVGWFNRSANSGKGNRKSAANAGPRMAPADQLAINIDLAVEALDRRPLLPENKSAAEEEFKAAGSVERLQQLWRQHTGLESYVHA